MKFTHGKKGHLLSMGDLADMFRSLHGMGSVSSRNLMIGGKPSSNQDVSNEDGEDKLDINDNNSSIWHRTNVVITRNFRIFFADVSLQYFVRFNSLFFLLVGGVV